MILRAIEHTPFARLFASLLRVPATKMNQTERLYRIDQLIQARGVIAVADLRRELEISLATLKRDPRTGRDRFNAPIEFDRDVGHAQEVLRRVKLLPSQQRRVNLKWFELIGRALMTRRRLRIDYFTRYRNERSEREVSPQRLVNYRGNWYLDAWCHKSEGVRMFSLDSIENAVLLDAKAKEVSLKQVDEGTVCGYGIYRGTMLTWATLVFSAEAARWVRSEVWHERQQGRDFDDARYLLKPPCSVEAPELRMDILRDGENVAVLDPVGHRKHTAARLAKAVGRYAG